jgi:hypothetical protein
VNRRAIPVIQVSFHARLLSRTFAFAKIAAADILIGAHLVGYARSSATHDTNISVILNQYESLIVRGPGKQSPAPALANSGAGFFLVCRFRSRSAPEQGFKVDLGAVSDVRL